LFDRHELLPGEAAYAEVRLERMLALERRDRFLVRSYSPVFTIGGGVVVEVGIHHRKSEPQLLERLQRLNRGDDAVLVMDYVSRSVWPSDLAELSSLTHQSMERVRSLIERQRALVLIGDRYAWGRAQLDTWAAKAQTLVMDYTRQRPIKPGMPIDELKAAVAPEWPLKVFHAVLQHEPWVVDREWVRLNPDPPSWSDAEYRDVERVYEAVRQGGFRPPSYQEIQDTLQLTRQRFDDVMEYLIRHQRVHRLEDGVVLADVVYEWGRQQVIDAIRRSGPLTTAELKETLGISRRYAVLFLELLDRDHVTRRVGERRELLL
jgi:selenocysteine-specific elongation factor